MADTGALYALAESADVWHARVVDWWSAAPRDVAVPVTVVPEVTYLLGRRLGAEAEEAFVRALARGELRVEELADADWSRVADLMVAYADLPLGFVDASIVAMAERLEVTEVLTTDRKHFGVVRPRHVERLTLLP
ncbi:MAG: PIN domain-containing protein [Gemmatimonadota bacterium]|nr:PIN domain-containing protein [Gemmatimonadota bacterium]